MDDDENDDEDDPYVFFTGPHQYPLFGYIMLPITAPIYYLIPGHPGNVRNFVCALVIFFVLNGFLVWLLEVVSEVTRVTDIILGYTLLTVAFLYTDLDSCVAVTKAGEGDMVISSSYGCLIFDILVSLPLPWFIRSCSIGFAPVVMRTTYFTLVVPGLIVIVFCFVWCLYLLKWQLKTIIGLILILLSCVLVAVAVSLEVVEFHAATFVDESRQAFPSAFPEDKIIGMPYHNSDRKSLILIHLYLILYIIYGMQILIDVHITYYMEYLVERIGLNILAGATVMNLVGSMPNLCTAFYATVVARNELGIGVVIGGSIFVLFEIGYCALRAPAPIVLSRWPILRDCTYYLMSLLCFHFFTVDGHVQFYEALVLLSAYCPYYILMQFNSKIEPEFLRGVSVESIAPEPDAKKEDELVPEIRPPNNGLDDEPPSDVHEDVVEGKLCTIDIKTITGQMLSIRVRDSDTIMSIKPKIQDANDTLPTKFGLHYKGSVLEDSMTLCSYGIGDGSVVYLVQRENEQAEGDDNCETPNHQQTLERKKNAFGALCLCCRRSSEVRAKE